MTTTKPRFTITVTEEILKEIDDFRYENRYPTRTQVVNELLLAGLKYVKSARNEDVQKKSKLNVK